ncbi:location of vulva defective 1-like isoform X2 [Argopecten irradians]|uniref:location of vulva defective 1-like isoform X2 n=1 Tax=Argopecten irradians TaxID=31199 RepID=UPI00371F896F
MTSGYLNMPRVGLLLIGMCSWLQYFVVDGHGYMLDPPGRSSMWRVGFDTVPNYDDNGLNCGNQHQPADFKDVQCGLCGDPLDQVPRDNEAGGKYASGIISKSYSMGDIITIKVLLTSNHLGFFEFRLCENNDVTKRITKQCLKHVLVNPVTGSTRYNISSYTTQHFELSAKLPDHVTCSQCVLQWRYRTGNTFHYTENDCDLCGSQEEFYACSDISIINSPSATTESSAKTTENDATTTTTTPEGDVTNTTTNPDSDVTTTSSTTDSDVTTDSDTMTITNPAITKKSTTTRKPTTSKPSGGRCVSLSVFVADIWCDINCNHSPPFCPFFLCKCSSF